MIEVLVAVGDTVAAEDPLVTLESDKATMDVPSPAAGTVAAIEVTVGDKVTEGSPILTLEVSGGNGSEPAPAGTVAEAVPAAAAEDVEAAADPSRPSEPASPPGARVAAGRDRRARRRTPSPGVRRLARELGVDLSTVQRHRPQGPDHQG